MLKSNKGITLISLVLAIIIATIILSMIVYNVIGYQNTKALDNLFNDIELLENKVQVYYIKHGTLPVDYAHSITCTIPTQDRNPNDNGNYYIIQHLEMLENLTLTYGNNDDYFIINEQSHTIYYPTGIELGGTVYYKLPANYEQLNGTNTSLYVQKGLILHYDGINNTGTGHSNTTTTWKDLVGSNDVQGITAQNWLNNGLFINQLPYASQNSVPAFGTNVTVEILLLNKQRKYTQIGLGMVIHLKLRIEGEKAYWNCYPLTFQYCTSAEPLNQITSFVYVNNYSSNKAAAYMDNVKVNTTASNMVQMSVPFYLSAGLETLDGNIYSIRLYNRALTDEEITRNYNIDKMRFGI